jgi:hypothetical protein
MADAHDGPTAEEKRAALREAGWHPNGQEGSSNEMWARKEGAPWMAPESAYRAMLFAETSKEIREPAPKPTYEYRMMLVQMSAEPEDIAKLLAGMNENQRWRPICFVPWVNLSNARVSGYILLERENRG